MILDLYSLTGSCGEYPISDFTIELNYDSASTLVVKMDASLLDRVKTESVMKFYYIDKCIFTGIPYFASRNDNEIELRIYDKNASLWTTSGFAISNSSAVFDFKNKLVYDIVKEILAGSQFSVTPSSVPSRKISIVGNWATKTDFMYFLAKQCTDDYGNPCTFWIDDNNVVYIGARNAGVAIDLSEKTSGSGNEDVNLINFGGVVIQGGKDVFGSNVIETSDVSDTYLQYDLRKKSLASFEEQHIPIANTTLSKIEMDDGEISIFFKKSASARLPYVDVSSPNTEYIRAGAGYTNTVILKDKMLLLDYDEFDMAFEVSIDNKYSNGMDNWLPYYSAANGSGWGPPYIFINNITIGTMDPDGNVICSVTMERICNRIYYYKPAPGSSQSGTLNGYGRIRFYLNLEKYNLAGSTTPGSIDPGETKGIIDYQGYDMGYSAYKNYKFLVWFKRRFDLAGNQWTLQVIRTNGTTVWEQIVGSAETDPDDCLFNQTFLYSNETPSNTQNCGGIPFIKSEMKTDVDTYFPWHGMKVRQITPTNNAYSIPLFLSTPQKTIIHKPYLLFSDTNIVYPSQAKNLARSLYNDYRSVMQAEVEIDPLAFYYSDTPVDVGCIAEFSSPAPITGSYRIRSITATPTSVRVGLQNRSARINDIVDRLQKQVKDIGAQ